MGGVSRSACGPAIARRLGKAALVLSLLVAASRCTAAEAPGASTSDETRAEARRAIPMAKIDPAFQQRVGEVVADPSLFRRLPTYVIDCRPELFTYLAQNPEALVEIWRHLGLSQVQLTRIDDKTFSISDGAGTTGKLHIVEQSCDDAAQNRIVMYAEGNYEGKPFQRPLSARCVLALYSGSTQETNGRHFVAARLDTFIKLDRMSLELVAKAVHPFVGQTADRNFADTLAFVSNLSYTAEKRPETVEELAMAVEHLDPRRRQELVRMARLCAEAGRQWRISRAAQVSAEVQPR
jgi:hypothetical protein